MAIELLTVVTLDREGRVKCQHEGCGRHVFARVHVIRQNGKVSFVGSTCFRKLFGDLDLHPSFGGSNGLLLSEEQRKQILANTEAFLEELRLLYEASKQQVSTEMPSEVRDPTRNLTNAVQGSNLVRGKPTHIHLFRCLTCSTPLINYEFESTERFCPQCKTVDNVFTLEKYPISQMARE